MVSGFHVFGDLFAILFAFEDNRSFMGGVMLCIVSGCCWLAQLWQSSGRLGVWLGLVSVHFPTICTISWTLGTPLLLLCNGPMSWQCSQEYLFDLVVDHVIFSLGLFSTSVFYPMY